MNYYVNEQGTVSHWINHPSGWDEYVKDDRAPAEGDNLVIGCSSGCISNMDVNEEIRWGKTFTSPRKIECPIVELVRTDRWAVDDDFPLGQSPGVRHTYRFVEPAVVACR